MSRLPRAGEAAPRRSFRATDAEWSAWERAARAEGCATLSAWIVLALNERAARVAPAERRKRKRCPTCNQLLYILEDGSIEPHMRGLDLVECLGAARPGKARRNRR